MAADHNLIIDDRRSGDYSATIGENWRLVTDGVMGGVSQGRLTPDMVEHRRCLRMQGRISLDHNGGFIQASLDLAKQVPSDIATYGGVLLEIYGNGEQYNVHLRTRANRLPWQSYRATFHAAPVWERIQIPFGEFAPYRIDEPLDIRGLTRIGIVAIGREFEADLCIGRLEFYR